MSGLAMRGLEGKRFGKLTVVSPNRNKKGQVCWDCVCDCGNKCQVMAGELNANRRKSCGCINQKKPIKRLWSKIQINNETGCWEYTGCKYGNGYGIFSTKEQRMGSAHRFVWELFNNSIPKNMCVLHTCDNPSCCNPDHLFLGTQQDNIKDMIKKGRGAKGSMMPNTKLKEEEVWLIKKLLFNRISKTFISKMFSVSRDVVNFISAGKSWNHVIYKEGI